MPRPARSSPRHSPTATWTTLPRSAPCSTRSRARWPRLLLTVRTTRRAFTPMSPRVIRTRPSLCRHARRRCRARRPRARRRSATATSSASPSTAAWAEQPKVPRAQRVEWLRRVADAIGLQRARPRRGGGRALETGDRGRAALAQGRAPGDRGGGRCPCAQSYAGAGTPDLCAHRLTPNGAGASTPALQVRATRRIRPVLRPQQRVNTRKRDSAVQEAWSVRLPHGLRFAVSPHPARARYSSWQACHL